MIIVVIPALFLVKVLLKMLHPHLGEESIQGTIVTVCFEYMYFILFVPLEHNTSQLYVYL